jgi:hypothetical protein
MEKTGERLEYSPIPEGIPGLPMAGKAPFGLDFFGISGNTNPKTS